MDILFSLFSSPHFEYFARSGGGGSGGGDSGGGIEILFGYLPMHFLGAGLRKTFKLGPAAVIAASITGWIVALAYSAFLVSIFHGIGFFVGIFALVGMGAGLYNWFAKIKQSPLVKKSLQHAASQDSAWDEAKLTQHATFVFMAYQQAWSKGDTTAMQTFMTPSYHQHASLLVYTLQLMKRQNIVDTPQITAMAIQHLHDGVNNDEDTFTIAIEAKANDKLIDISSSRILFTDASTFVEHWTFVRSGDTWLLDNISQVTASQLSRNAQLESWASSLGYYYSQDMGWLFIPERGQLFDGAKFGTSDINNHIVGLYNNQLLVQIYSYVKNPAQNGKSYVIAQVNVPRNYGNIVVRRKKALQLFGIKGLERVETEWTKFNQKYEVFATNYEQATSFELLNPTYMEQLEALPFEVNIDVVDNVVYLFTDERGTSLETYTTMLDLINKAFKEMRL
ncbi:DUF3137 domain-containing protein [Microbacteriaceae bacterium]|nr:DUF3137 domain-containing protein [Candidatus Saccharibacteria bacterium]